MVTHHELAVGSDPGRRLRLKCGSSIFSGEDTNHRHAEKGFSLKLGSDSCRRLGFDNF